MSAAYEKVARDILNNVKDGDDVPGDVDAIVGILEREFNPDLIRFDRANRVVSAARRFMQFNGSGGEKGTYYDAAKAYKYGEELNRALEEYRRKS